MLAYGSVVLQPLQLGVAGQGLQVGGCRSGAAGRGLPVRGCRSGAAGRGNEVARKHTRNAKTLFVAQWDKSQQMQRHNMAVRRLQVR